MFPPGMVHWLSIWWMSTEVGVGLLPVKGAQIESSAKASDGPWVGWWRGRWGGVNRKGWEWKITED